MIINLLHPIVTDSGPAERASAVLDSRLLLSALIPNSIYLCSGCLDPGLPADR